MKLFYLSLIAFLVVGSSSIFGVLTLVNSQKNKASEVQEEKVFETKIVPVLSGGKSFPLLSAQSILVTDVDSETVLYEKNPDGQFFPASTTKIITALTALDYFPLDEVLTVGNVKVDGQKMDLKFGEKIRVRDILYGLLVHSANDAAEVLAQKYLGGRDAFVNAMNEKALEMGLSASHFQNPSGLDEDDHFTTARDLTIAAKVTMRDDFLRTVVGTKDKEVRSTDGIIVHELANVNKLIGDVDGVLGVKTGWTELARENLVTYIQKDGKTISLVVLGSQDRFGETKELIDWIFKNYAWKNVRLSSN